MTNYKESGVDLQLGDDASRVLYEAAKLTWQNRRGRLGEVITPNDDFSGVRYIDANGLTNCVMNVGFDGVGTKIEIAERVGDHTTIAFDLFAMVCDDAARYGAEPVLVGSILDVNKLDINVVKQLAVGYVNAANAANVVVVNGEVAELGARVNGYRGEGSDAKAMNYNWGAACVWFARKDRLISGKEIEPGQSIVAVRENGFRSNGLSLVRRILENEYGAEWHQKRADLAHAILTPSVIYSGAIGDIVGGYEGEQKAKVTGIAHITGGGIPGKLGRLLKPTGFGAYLDTLFELSPVMEECQRIGNVSDEEAHHTWNMGQGMLVVTPEPDTVLVILRQHNLEARVAGKILERTGITLVSRGVQSPLKRLGFEVK